MKCGWCNNSTDLEYYSCVPERWGNYHFCKMKKCAVYYDSYVYRHDLTNGLPHVVKEFQSSNQCCDFCGNINNNVVHLPFNSLAHKTFCRNNICYRKYISFIDHYTVETLAEIIPYSIRSTFITELQKPATK
jgi:hypothetical protein